MDFLNPRFTPPIHPSIPGPWTPPLCLASDTGSFDAEKSPIATDPAVAVTAATAGWFALKLDLGASAAPKISSHFGPFQPISAHVKSFGTRFEFHATSNMKDALLSSSAPQLKVERRLEKIKKSCIK